MTEFKMPSWYRLPGDRSPGLSPSPQTEEPAYPMASLAGLCLRIKELEAERDVALASVEKAEAEATLLRAHLALDDVDQAAVLDALRWAAAVEDAPPGLQEFLTTMQRRDARLCRALARCKVERDRARAWMAADGHGTREVTGALLHCMCGCAVVLADEPDVPR